MSLNFKRVELADREIIESYTYASRKQNCDISFGNIYCYAELLQMEWCECENIMFLRFHIGSGRKSIYCEFGGERDVDRVVGLLMEDAKSIGEPLRLFNLSEEFVKRVESSPYRDRLFIYTDRDYYDYIYLADKLRSLSGKELQPKRNHVNKFRKSYQYRYEEIEPRHKGEIMGLVRRWRDNKRHEEALVREECVIERAMDNFKEIGLHGIALYVEDKLVAFSFGTPINETTFDVIAEKGDISYDGVYAMINKLFVESLPPQYIYINREEDLGIPGLRKAKLSYAPELLYKKWYALASDAEGCEVMHLWRELFGDDPSFILHYVTHYSSERKRLLHYEDGKLVGMVHLQRFRCGEFQIGYFYALGVHPDYRNRGVAHALMEELFERQREEGDDISLCIPADEEIKRWYIEKFGFRETGCGPLTFKSPDDFDFGTGDPAKNIGIYKPLWSCSDNAGSATDQHNAEDRERTLLETLRSIHELTIL